MAGRVPFFGEWLVRAGRFVTFIFRRFTANQGMLNASALTYTTLFAVVPLMTVTYSMLASIPSFQGVGEQLEALIFDHFVPSTGDTVKTYLSGFAAQARTLTAVGVAFLVVTAYMMLKSIESAFNKVWQVTEPRRGMASFLLYWAVLSLGPLLLGVGFVLSSYVASLPLVSDATEVLGGREQMLELLPYVLSAAAFTLLYAAVPNCPVPLKHAAVGGAVVALLFEGAKWGFTLFVTQFPSYKLIYGAFAAFPLFLAWIFISWVIVLIGAELVRGLEVFRDEEANAPQDASVLVLELLDRLWQAHQRGEACQPATLLKQVPGLNQAAFDRYLPVLMAQALVVRTSEGALVLARDLSEVRLWALFQALRWPLPPSQVLTSAKGWHALLRERVQRLEACGTAQLNIPLDALFANRLAASENSCTQGAVLTPRVAETVRDQQASLVKTGSARGEYE